jgi:hypothetical protein
MVDAAKGKSALHGVWLQSCKAGFVSIGIRSCNSQTPLHGGRMVRIYVLRIDCGIGGFGFRGTGWVDGVSQLLGRFEKGHTLSRDIDFGACLWIASSAGVTLAGAKASEAANLDLVASLESSDDSFEEGIDDDLTIAAGEVAQGGDFIYEVSFGHKWVPFVLGRAIGAEANNSVVVDCRRDGRHLVSEKLPNEEVRDMWE